MLGSNGIVVSTKQQPHLIGRWQQKTCHVPVKSTLPPHVLPAEYTSFGRHVLALMQFQWHQACMFEKGQLFGDVRNISLKIPPTPPSCSSSLPLSQLCTVQAEVKALSLNHGNYNQLANWLGQKATFTKPSPLTCRLYYVCVHWRLINVFKKYYTCAVSNICLWCT